MQLVPKRAEAAPLQSERLASGAGAFVTMGGPGHEHAHIAVHYYKPSGFTKRSPILLIIPGAGRNGDAYRDAWIGAARDHNVLVAALSYPESDYDFAAYQMGGVIRDLVISNLPIGPDGRPPDSVHLHDEDISFRVNPDPQTWLFNDFDRVFAQLAAAANSSQTSYDMFGHSAGGQILHRHALFSAQSRTDRIIAANAGLYTLPDLDLPQPMGLKDTGLNATSLRRALSRKLTVLLGEQDNDGEEGGIQLHTPTIDRYGVDRLTRGRTFYEAGRACADRYGAPFQWTLETVPNVGHDFRAMGRAAAALLYG